MCSGHGELRGLYSQNSYHTNYKISTVDTKCSILPLLIKKDLTTLKNRVLSTDQLTRKLIRKKKVRGNECVSVCTYVSMCE